MKSYWGRIDVEAEMPSEEQLKKWEREARAQYNPKIEKRRFERFTIEYVWNKVADWQEGRRDARTILM